MANLTVDVAGIKLKNPFVVGSSHAATPKGLKRAAEEGWAAGVISGGRISGMGGGKVSGYIMRQTEFVDRPPAVWAYENSARTRFDKNVGYSQRAKNVENFLKDLKGVDIPIGATIAGPDYPEPWVPQAIAAEKFGATFVELNFSVPHVPNIGLNAFGKEPAKIKPVVKAVRQNCSLPLFIKLTAQPLHDQLIEMAKWAVDAGANGLTVGNALAGFIGVDIETGRPLCLDMDCNGRLRGGVYGVSGPIMKPLAMKAVADLYHEQLGVPIMGVGGITTWEDAVEFMMLGANAVQVAAGVMLYGWRLVKEMIWGLDRFMDRKGYKSVEDFIGITTKQWGVADPHTFLALEQPRKMIVNEEKCDGCGRCMPACEASGSGAIQVRDRLAAINHEVCEQCNACMIVCPQGAVSVVWDPGVLPEET